MKSHHRNDSELVLIVVGLVVLVLAFFISKFSELLGWEFVIGLKVALGVVLLTIVLGCVIRFGDPYNGIWIGNTWPLFVAAFWLCLWPGVVDWAGGSPASSATENVLSYIQPTRSESFSIEPELPWWSSQFTKWGVFFAIIFGGYFVRYLRRDDYYHRY